MRAKIVFPEFGSSRNKGDSITQSLFIPIGRSADVTLSGVYFTEAGNGAALRSNIIPNTKGSALFDAFWIRDETEGDKDRYRATFKQTQEFENGFKLFADLNFVSDFDFLTDFERDLDIVTSPTILVVTTCARSVSG